VLALIMAGGAGMRLMSGEKPLVPVNDRPMIAWVTGAFGAAGCDPVVVITSRTPLTGAWCREHGIRVLPAAGKGYVEDMVEAVQALGEKDPLFISVSDLPCLGPQVIRKIRGVYRKSEKDACSVWVPETLLNTTRDSMPYCETVDGVIACPAGINILRGDRIGSPQDELKLLIRDRGLAFNVNTREDGSRAEEYLKKHPAG